MAAPRRTIPEGGRVPRRGAFPPPSRLAAVLGAALALAPSPAASRAIIVYPRDGTAVTSANINIYGTITERVEVVKLRLNGQLVIPMVGASRTFEQSVRLRPGVNEFEVADKVIRVAFVTPKQPAPEGFVPRILHQAVLDGCPTCHDFKKPGDFSPNAPPRELCLGCHDDPALGKDRVRLAVGHSPVTDDGDCLACHNPHTGDTRSLNAKPIPALCYECHDPVAAGRPRVHEPAGSDCMACHAAHASANKRLLREAGDALCLGCHDDPSADMSVVHDAMGEGCRACHDPHASRQKGMLTGPQTELCGGCHDDVPPRGKGVTVHSPIADDAQCTACHAPHASKARKLLLKQPPALCADCHDDVTSAGRDKGSVHPPAAEGSCGDCHDPHGGPSALLRKRGGELCRDCHDAFTAPPGGSLHEPAGGDCSECHLPHASARKALLAEAGGALCARCHEPFRGRTVHGPVGDGDCLACHRPHSSSRARLLVKGGMELCLECHENPVAPPMDRVVRKFTVHGPIRDGRECTPCHSPHAGEKALLVAPPPALCDACHGSVTRGPDKVPMPYVHTPVAGGACLDCHRSHASAEDALLVSPARRELCLTCHDDPGVPGKDRSFVSKHPPVLQGCGDCHLAHASAVKGNLRMEPFPLCSTCHRTHDAHSLSAQRVAGQGGGGKGMARMPEGFPITEDRQMVCTGCHRPHGSEYPNLMPSPKEWLCNRCHNF